MTSLLPKEHTSTVVLRCFCNTDHNIFFTHCNITHDIIQYNKCVINKTYFLLLRSYVLFFSFARNFLILSAAEASLILLTCRIACASPIRALFFKSCLCFAFLSLSDRSILIFIVTSTRNFVRIFSTCSIRCRSFELLQQQNTL